ncbi:MAG: glycoside hydrolase family 15 protein [Ktedonobacterales bacterium]
MPRDLPLANGHMLVNFDKDYNLRDIYWPHIGLHNQTEGHVSHSGVWVDGRFSWFGADGWRRSLRYQQDSLLTEVTLTNDELQLTIECADVVDFDRDVLIRRMRVTNGGGGPREVRLFFHHDWHIGESDGGNTVYYRPQQKALVAYKDRCTILVGGKVGGDTPGSPDHAVDADVGISHWAIGYKEFNGHQGTWLDAEDGELGGNPIAQGSVDSCAGFWLGKLDPGTSRACYHWLAIAKNLMEVLSLHQMIIERGPELLLQRTHDYWHLWVTTKPLDLGDLPSHLVDLYKRSLLVIRTQIDDDGAVVAATDGDVWSFARDSYAYMWPRDGALVANALSHSGYSEITSAFFHFCSHVITHDGYLLHKYTPEGAVGSSWQPWLGPTGELELPIQEDETALVVYALWQHYSIFHEVEFVRPLYRPLIKAAAEFMVQYREPRTKLPAPSWDLWEERHGIHAYTVAAVYAGLTAAANFADAFGEADHAARYRQAADEIQTAARLYLWNDQAGRFVRMINVAPDGTPVPDMTLDASISGLYQFGMFTPDSQEISQTMAAVECRLRVKAEAGGYARYENDYYHQVSHDLENVPGNPWFICSCWIAEYWIARAETVEELHKAIPLLEWVQQRSLPSGVLAEQIDPYSDAPLSVSPLTWSHAEYVSVVRWYVGKYRRLVQRGASGANS